MNYASLSGSKTTEGSIKRWMNYALLDVDQIIEEAQALIFQTLRVREMRTQFANLTLSVGESYEALPTGFLDPIHLKDITNNIDLDLRDETELQRMRIYDDGDLATASAAYNYAIFDEKLQFEIKYDTAATLVMIGYKAPTFVSSTNSSNFLCTRYPHLMRVACMAQAADFMNNAEREQKYLTKLAALIQQTNSESDMTYRGVALNIGIG